MAVSGWGRSAGSGFSVDVTRFACVSTPPFVTFVTVFLNTGCTWPVHPEVGCQSFGAAVEPRITKLVGSVIWPGPSHSPVTSDFSMLAAS